MKTAREGRFPFIKNMSELTRLEVISAPGRAELLNAALALHVSHGWEEIEAPDGGLLALVHSKSGDFCRELAATLRGICPEWHCSLSVAPEEDWVSTWKEFFTPVEAGSRFLVLAPWMEAERAAATRRVITIEPKTAFGTGHHATTALCLRALSDLADAGRVRPGQRFFDLGTGSGILGIGAALLGLTGAGADVDLQAVENALENRALNGIAPEAFRVERGSLEAAGEERFDLVLANILAEPLINLAEPLARRLKEGAPLVLSGVLEAQAPAVAGAYKTAGAWFGTAEPVITRQAEWVSLVWS